jgi:lipopolysaccharide export system protein LptA
MDYDGKTGIAIFTGENYGVLVVSPTFTIYCDKLTAYMRKTGTATTPGAKGSPGPKPTASPPGNASASPSASPASGGLKRAIAEGTLIHPAVVVQDKPATNGEDAQHNVGIGQKADYNADTGDIVLTGWPRVSQGINTQIATSAGTVMTMNRDGRTLKTRGPSRTVIQEVTQPAKTGTNAASASPSPTP